jgi:hypothetical protein
VGFVYGTIPRKPAESLKQNVLWNLAKLGLCYRLLDIVSSGFCYRNSPCSLLQCPPSGPAGLWEHWPQSGCIPVFSRSMRQHAQKNKTQFRITIHESELPVLRLLHLHKYKSITFVERTRTHPVSTVATSLQATSLSGPSRVTTSPFLSASTLPASPCSTSGAGRVYTLVVRILVRVGPFVVTCTLLGYACWLPASTAKGSGLPCPKRWSTHPL